MSNPHPPPPPYDHYGGGTTAGGTYATPTHGQQMQPMQQYPMQQQQQQYQYQQQYPAQGMQQMQPMQPMHSSQTVIYQQPPSTTNHIHMGSPAPQVMLSPMYVQQAPSPVQQAPMMGSMPANPCPCRCPNCGRQVVSRVVSVTGTVTWAWFVALLLIIPFGCCVIPFFVPACQDQQHFCPQCNALVGTRQSC